MDVSVTDANLKNADVQFGSTLATHCSVFVIVIPSSSFLSALRSSMGRNACAKRWGSSYEAVCLGGDDDGRGIQLWRT